MSAPLLTEKQLRWAIEKSKQGYTYEEIAEALYVCDMTLRRSLKRYGYQVRKNRARPGLVLPNELKEGVG